MLRECGFRRISMGVQDFDARVQEAVQRIQPVDLTAALVEISRRAGFESVNFDLIYGLPYQTEETFAATLDAVLSLDPDRIALYSYAHVTWVAKQQRGFERKDLPDARTKARVMLAAIRRFLEAGYRFIGLDHFAKPEDELSQAVLERTLRRNFMGYTTQAGVELLGFGPSSISELRGSYAQSQRELEAWQEAVKEGGFATLRGHVLSRDDIERRWVIGRIMCHGELRATEFEQAEIAVDVASGLGEPDLDRLQIPPDIVEALDSGHRHEAGEDDPIDLVLDVGDHRSEHIASQRDGGDADGVERFEVRRRGGHCCFDPICEMQSHPVAKRVERDPVPHRAPTI